MPPSNKPGSSKLKTEMEDQQAGLAQQHSTFVRFWRQFRKRGTNIAGLVVAICLVLLAIYAPYITPYDPLETDYSNILGPPNLKHPLGTDWMGRDLLSRLIAGSRLSLSVGIIAVLIGLLGGGLLGILAGFYPHLDNVIMRFVDILLAFPGLLLSITIVATLGPGLQNVMIAVGIGSISGYARLVRGEVLAAREEDFVEAARALGAPDLSILTKHVIPNIMSPIIVLITFNLAGSVLSAAALSFLGLGAQPPEPEWGMLINEGRRYMLEAPWLVVGPGLTITAAILGFNLLGDGLRDALDPRMGE